MVKSSVLVAAATPRELAQFLLLRYDSNDPGPSCPLQSTTRHKPTDSNEETQRKGMHIGCQGMDRRVNHISGSRQPKNKDGGIGL